jgi:hypothetical protein
MGSYRPSKTHINIGEQIELYLWFKGQALNPSRKGLKFEPKCQLFFKKSKIEQRIFFVLFFVSKFSVFLTTSSLSPVSLTLALYAWLSAYAFAMSPSPLPCLDITQPLPACTFATVLSHGFPPLPLISQYAQARETQPRVRIGPVSVSPGPPISPPGCLTTTLSVLTSFSLSLGLLCS